MRTSPGASVMLMAALAALPISAVRAQSGNFSPISLRPVYNRTLADNSEHGEGRGTGFAAQGRSNCLAAFPRGPQTFRSVPFDVPAAGLSALLLHGTALNPVLPDLPRDVPIPVAGIAARDIYILGTEVFGGVEPKELATIIVTYADGSKEELDVVNGRNAVNWWTDKPPAQAAIAWSGDNGGGNKVSVFVMPFKLKNATGPIQSIDIRSSPDSDASLAIIGLTVGNTPPVDILPPPPVWTPSPDNSTEGWWPVDVPFDTAATPAPWESAMDAFNQPSGSLGWTVASGENLVFEKAPTSPVRFQGACGTTAAFYPAKSEAVRYARILRKFGFNQIRLHSLFDVLLKHEGDYIVPEYNEARLDKFDNMFAECKKAGIYVLMSGIFSARWAPSTGIMAADQIQPLNNSWYYYDPKHQEIYLDALRKFLTHRNPYTGLTYAEDPTLNMYMILNESSLFFNSDGAPAAYRVELQDLWNARLKAKYGTDVSLAEAWNVSGEPQALDSTESLSSGTVALKGVWDLATGKPQYKIRSAEQTRFYEELESNWIAKVTSLFRTLGSKALIQGSSWGGPGYLQEIQSASSAAGDYTGKHTYWNHPSGGWSLTDALFWNTPVTQHPNDHMLMCAYEHVAGKPFAITEWQFATPNDFTNDAPAFMAAYGAFQNINANHRFVYTSPDMTNSYSDFFNNFSMPASMALEPSAYFMYVRGDVHPGPVIYQNALTNDALHDSFRGKSSKVADTGSRFFMAFGDQQVPNTAMLAGGVRLSLDPAAYPAKWDAQSFATADDKRDQRIVSNTGELVWDYGKGNVSVRTEKTRGLFGFFANGEYENGPLLYTLNNAYGDVTFSSLDGRPLESSKRILLSLVGRTRNTGETFDILTQDGKAVTFQPPYRLGRVGDAPLIAEPATVSFNLRTETSGSWTLQPLDVNGAPIATETAALPVTGGTLAGTVDGSKYRAFTYLLTCGE